MQELAGKVAVISGAARGQGRSHAVRLASEGADIIALDICHDMATWTTRTPPRRTWTRRRARCEHSAGASSRRSPMCADGLAVKQAVDDAVAETGRLDIVIPQAGITSFTKERSYEEKLAIWSDVLAVNVTGYFHLLEAALPHVVAGGRGGRSS